MPIPQTYTPAAMDPTADPATLVRSLAQNLAAIEDVERRLSPAQLEAAPSADGWSPNQVLWHIRATADVYGEHITRILNEDRPRWRHVSPRARMKTARYDQLTFAESFAAFQRQRADLLALLGSIAPAAWRRTALVRVADREDSITFHDRVWRMAIHEEIHCTQISELAEPLHESR